MKIKCKRIVDNANKRVKIAITQSCGIPKVVFPIKVGVKFTRRIITLNEVTINQVMMQ